MTPNELKTLRHKLPAREESAGVGRPSSGGNGWTQRRFAEALGISPRTYEGYEREGATVPPAVARLASLIAEAMRAK